MIRPSPAESRRFGLKAGRVEAARIDPEALQREVVAGAWDWVILRLPTGQEACIERLRALGLEPQPVDTLMTWSLDLQRAALPAASTVVLRAATRDDAPAIAALVRSVFARYPNHYTANPWLDPALALEGYVEWALGHVDDPAALCWLACLDGAIAGLSCSRHDPARDISVGALHGVDPRFAGRGVYRAMIEASLRHYREAGYREFRISTQAGNQTVQNLWARLGLRLDLSQTTLHLMPLLGRALGAEPRVPGRDATEHLSLDSVPGARSIRPTLLRRSLYCLPDCDPDRAAQVRSTIWHGSGSARREIDAFCDDGGRLLAWQHTERTPGARSTTT